MSKLELNSFGVTDASQTNNSPYFIDRLFTEEEQRRARNHDAFRFAADIASRSNKEYLKYLSQYGDMRLRIVHVQDSKTLLLGSMAGIPIAKVTVQPDTGGTSYSCVVSGSLKERGSDTSTIQSMKPNVAIKSLFSAKSDSDMPRIFAAVRETWNRHQDVIYANINYCGGRVLSENGCSRPASEVNWSRDMAGFLLESYYNSGGLMPTMEVAQLIADAKALFDRDRTYYARANELAEEAYGSDRWAVIRAEAGFVIGKIKVPPSSILKGEYYERATVVMPFVFVRKFEELAAISTSLHEEFMGAYVMMRAAEPNFSRTNFMYGCQYVPFADIYMKNTHTTAYYQSSGRFDGGISLTFRALA